MDGNRLGKQVGDWRNAEGKDLKCALQKSGRLIPFH
jgi:hypothetical protein